MNMFDTLNKFAMLYAAHCALSASVETPTICRDQDHDDYISINVPTIEGLPFVKSMELRLHPKPVASNSNYLRVIGIRHMCEMSVTMNGEYRNSIASYRSGVVLAFHICDADEKTGKPVIRDIALSESCARDALTCAIYHGIITNQIVDLFGDQLWMESNSDEFIRSVQDFANEIPTSYIMDTRQLRNIDSCYADKGPLMTYFNNSYKGVVPPHGIKSTVTLEQLDDINIHFVHDGTDVTDRMSETRLVDLAMDKLRSSDPEKHYGLKNLVAKKEEVTNNGRERSTSDEQYLFSGGY